MELYRNRRILSAHTEAASNQNRHQYELEKEFHSSEQCQGRRIVTQGSQIWPLLDQDSFQSLANGSMRNESVNDMIVSSRSTGASSSNPPTSEKKTTQTQT